MQEMTIEEQSFNTDDLRKVSSAVYLATEESIAKHISKNLLLAASLIDKLRAENELLKSQVIRLQVDDPFLET
jgi:hypothetical protein